MTATNFNTNNDTFRKLMGNGLSYRIPRFQRDYSWTEDEWEDLWLDILETTREGGEPAHYMGYLVLQSDDGKFFDIIDGQQRITTLTLIVIAILKNLQRLVNEGRDADDNKRRLEQIRQTYIGYLDPVTLVSRPKLTLNRNNDHYFKTYIVPLEKLPQRGFRASEHLLRKAFEWFESKIREEVRKRNGREGAYLAELVETMSDHLFFTVISVTDELNAYKVFETLNARGVRLSATDLLKNYLFSVLHRGDEHEHEMDVLENRWEILVGRLGSESFPDFLRFHWLSRRSFVRQSELFKTIRGQIRSREDVFALLRAMEEDVETYLALTQPESSAWENGGKTYATQLRMFNVKQPYSLIMAAHRQFPQEDFIKLLRACMVISFRYNVIGGSHTGEQERVYYNVAQRISQGDVRTFTEAIQQMQTIYPSDNAFRAAFTEKIIKTTSARNGRIVRYVLCEIEKHKSGQDIDFDSDKFNIEHILPQNPSSGWEDFSENATENFVYRIGNMTLLSRAENQALANADFATKKNVYAKSTFAITRQIAEENAEWNPGRLETRQKWMAKQAAALWCIPQLSVKN